MAEQEWQPIETAPKDGTAVLIAVPDYEVAIIANWYRYNGLETWRDEELDIYPTATHWQPLPTPPTAA